MIGIWTIVTKEGDVLRTDHDLMYTPKVKERIMLCQDNGYFVYRVVGIDKDKRVLKVRFDHEDKDSAKSDDSGYDDLMEAAVALGIALHNKEE